MDILRTGQQVRRLARTPKTNSNTFFCQGEGRGFESSLPLSKSRPLAGLMRIARLIEFSFSAHRCPLLPITCPSRDKAGAMDAVRVSIRQRGSGSFELRVYGGTDPVSGKRRWLTRTVRGDRSAALRELKALTAHANIAPAVGAHTTVAALLDQWFARGRSTWSPTTIRNLTSIIERHLKPGLGDILVGDVTTAIVDGFYEDLRSGGRIDGKPLAVGTVRGIHSALHAALAQAQRWSWVFETSPTMQLRPEMNRLRCDPPRQTRWHSFSSSCSATWPSIYT